LFLNPIVDQPRAIRYPNMTTPAMASLFFGARGESDPRGGMSYLSTNDNPFGFSMIPSHNAPQAKPSQAGAKTTRATQRKREDDRAGSKERRPGAFRLVCGQQDRAT